MSSLTERMAARIVSLREQRGWSQEHVARRAGIHRVTLANIERGVKQPTLDTLDRLARALGIKLTDLVK